MLTVSCSRDPRSTGVEYAPQMYHSIPLEGYSQMDYNKHYNDKANAQNPVAGSIAQGKLDYVFPYPNNADGYEQAGKEFKNPNSVDEKYLAEGKRLFINNCSHCHGAEGGNDGNVMAGGKFPKPGWANYQDKYIQNLPEGKIYFTITYGKNLMGSHATQLNPEQRWKVVSYVKFLSKKGATAESTDAKTEKTETKTDSTKTK